MGVILMGKTDYSELASSIVRNLGGKENLTNINHCATRLRVYVKDNSKVNMDALKKIKNVLGVEHSNDQYQVIVGQIVENVYNEVEQIVGKMNGKETKSQNKGALQLLSSFFLMLAGIMSPIIPALVTAGFLQTVLIIISLTGVISTDSSTYTILNMFANAVFYYLPVFVAYTSAKKFNVEPVIAMLVAVALLHPTWVNMASAGGYTSYFGLPVLLTTYNGSVVPIVLSIWVMSKIDKLLKKIIPQSVTHFLKPFLLVIIMSVIVLVLTGPCGGLISGYITEGVLWIQKHAGVFTVAVVVLLSNTIGQLLAGIHMALVPLAIDSIAKVGYDDIVNVWFLCFTISAASVALAVTMKTKNNNLRQISVPAMFSGFFGGVSEPTTYGISYKMVKPFWANAIASTAAALLAGILKLKAYAFGGYSLINILVYLGPNKDYANFRNAIIVVIFDIVLTIILVYAFGFDDSVYDDETPAVKRENLKLKAPATGTFIKQKDIADSSFASGVLGACFGVKPSDDTITAPVDGEIVMVAETGHAIAIQTKDGSEVMVHIGIDSVKLGGKGIKPIVSKGQKVGAGEVIAIYDKAVFDEAGINDTVICILLNSNDYKEINFTDEAAKDRVAMNALI